MEIPILTKFIDGLKLFFASKRLRWLTFLFIIGILVISIVRGYALWIIDNAAPSDVEAVRIAARFVSIVTGGVWVVFFMITSFLSLIGLQKLVASETSYLRSILVLVPWMIISLIGLFFFAVSAFYFVFFGLVFIVAFIGWIGFQAYFSTRTSLQYAEVVDTTSTSAIVKIFAFFLNMVSYVVIFGSWYFTVTIVNPSAINNGLLFLGMVFALVFNFLNTIILFRHRNQGTVDNVAMVGLFISLYSAYFIYNAGKPLVIGIDFVGIAVSLFFVLYTMSSVGRTLSSRAELDTRWKISKELAATFTFFLATGYYYANAMLATLLEDPSTGIAAGDAIKLLLFPLIALVMELLYLRKETKEMKLAMESSQDDEFDSSISGEEDSIETDEQDNLGNGQDFDDS